MTGEGGDKIKGIIAEGKPVTPDLCIKVGVVGPLGEACVVLGTPNQN